MKDKSLILILFLIFILFSITTISAENDTVQNTHNADLNDTKYINARDYYYDENGTRTPYTSDVGSYNNVTMSNGYNAYAIQNGGYIETNDQKTHPSFWNDTFHIVDANDTDTVKGHWYYAGGKPIGEYLKILFYKHYDDLVKISPNPNIPSSIYVQSIIWDLYEYADDIEKLEYQFTREAISLYNDGFRVNNTANLQWINETTYRIFDFMGFKNENPYHKDMWGFRVQYFNKTPDNESDVPDDSPVNETNKTEKTNQTIEKNESTDGKMNYSTDKKEDSVSSIKSNRNLETGNPIYLLIGFILLIALVISVKRI